MSRALGRGGGTTLPGHVADRIDPGLIAGLARALPNGCVLVTGTNGKTTTTRIMAGAARAAGLEVITNPEGSNMLSGIATSLLVRTNSLGVLEVPDSAIGIFEVDEGALPGAIETLSPRLVVITNLFRDQLDRYFEVDFIAHLWQRALSALGPSTTVVLNADDPQVAYLGEGIAARVMYFGLEDRQWARAVLEHAADSRRCPQCSHDLVYEMSFYAHLGHYACKECGWRRPDPRFAAWKVRLQGIEGSESQTSTPAGDRTLRLPLPGLYNACNALAAAAASSCLGVDPDLVQVAAQGTVCAFGRFERISVEGKNAVLLLVKNPTGFNESLRLVLAADGLRYLLLGLNSNSPDGRDVSWIWDVEFEACAGRVEYLAVSGQRANDLALRLKYAGVADSRGGPDASALSSPEGEDIVRTFFAAIEQMPERETLYVLASYTALWTLRRELVRRGYLAPFFQQVEGGDPMKLVLGYLYPSVMSQYGDRGNVLTIQKRCQWRGIDVEVDHLEVGDRVDPDRVDLLLVGGGADTHQRLVCEDLLHVKGDGIRRAVEDGAAAFAVCAGYQLWGHYYRTATGDELPGLGVFPAHTVHRAAQTGTRLDTITKAGSVRAVGNLVVRWGTRVLVGFENHGGRTYLDGEARPFGRVLAGSGNNSEDGWEGCVHNNAIGTYMHGPAFPKNPALADHLIKTALTRRYGSVTLDRLDDARESTARQRALQQATARPGRWRRLWSDGVG